ncbi:MAG: hypothetical protein P8N92_09120, partial [Burkholderiales bacterium]|nr:hypothetical protein [Burkholderiales bacterium]
GEAWLWRIARHGLVDFKRKKYRDNRDRPSVTDNDDLFEASNVTPKQFCLNRGLTRFMKEEPDRASSLEMLAEGRSITEISAALGRSIGATKEYLSQCRKKLKPYVQHCYELLKGY